MKLKISESGLIAILRGIRPEEAATVGRALYGVGIRVIEVPLNSPEPFRSISELRNAVPADCVIGGGTVYRPIQVEQVRQSGGELIVMPHNDRGVIEAAHSSGLAVIPGVATCSEAFSALAAGCSLLKFFPADQLGPSTLKAWRSVLPVQVQLLPVGGIAVSNMGVFLTAGACGFGLGSGLYRAGMAVNELAVRGAEFVSAWSKHRISHT